MIALRVKTRSDVQKVLAQTRQAQITNLGHVGAAIRLAARRSIRRNKRQSAAGTPPHTRRGQLKRAIVYAVEPSAERVTVGPTHQVVGRAGSAHEHGGRYKRERYQKRPFMGPALEKTIPRLPRMWAGSVR